MPYWSEKQLAEKYKVIIIDPLFKWLLTRHWVKVEWDNNNIRYSDLDRIGSLDKHVQSLCPFLHVITTTDCIT